MKRYALLMLCVVQSCSDLYARGDGGAIAAGTLGGLAVGTLIGSASANQSRRLTREEERAIRAQERAEQEAVRAQKRAEQEAIRAQEKVERIRIEQAQQRIAQLERELEHRSRELEHRSMEHKIVKSQVYGRDRLQMLLIVLIGILTLAVIGLSVLVVRRKP